MLMCNDTFSCNRFPKPVMESPTDRATTGRASPQPSRMPKPSTMQSPRLQVRAGPEHLRVLDTVEPPQLATSSRPNKGPTRNPIPPPRSPAVVSVRVRVPTGGMARGCHAFAAPGRPKAAHDRRGRPTVRYPAVPRHATALPQLVAMPQSDARSQSVSLPCGVTRIAL